MIHNLISDATFQHCFSEAIDSTLGEATWVDRETLESSISTSISIIPFISQAPSLPVLLCRSRGPSLTINQPVHATWLHGTPIFYGPHWALNHSKSRLSVPSTPMTAGQHYQDSHNCDKCPACLGCHLSCGLKENRLRFFSSLFSVHNFSHRLPVGHGIKFVFT